MCELPDISAIEQDYSMMEPPLASSRQLEHRGIKLCATYKHSKRSDHLSFELEDHLLSINQSIPRIAVPVTPGDYGDVLTGSPPVRSIFRA
jgi:hypothetical protein